MATTPQTDSRTDSLPAPPSRATKKATTKKATTKTPAALSAQARPTAKLAMSASGDTAAVLRALDEGRARLMRSLELLRADVDATTDGAEAETSFNEEDSEGTSSMATLDQLRALMSTTIGQLAEIDAAVERIGNGSYGTCTTCQQTIPAARLEALPAATQCVTCKAGSILRR